eukprot:Opistho-2@45255
MEGLSSHVGTVSKFRVVIAISTVSVLLGFFVGRNWGVGSVIDSGITVTSSDGPVVNYGAEGQLSAADLAKGGILTEGGDQLPPIDAHGVANGGHSGEPSADSPSVDPAETNAAGEGGTNISTGDTLDDSPGATVLPPSTDGLSDEDPGDNANNLSTPSHPPPPAEQPVPFHAPKKLATEPRDDPPYSFQPDCGDAPYGIKTVLMYSNPWGGVPCMSFAKCPVSNCVMVWSRDYTETADALIFFRHFEPAPIPPRNPNQVWVMFELEVPLASRYPNMGVEADRPFSHLRYNWTMTFNLESDVPTHYESFGDRLYMPRLLGPFPRKIARVLFMAMNCGSESGREAYVQQLMQHMEVHSYGSCLHNKDFLNVDGAAVYPPGRYEYLTAASYNFIGMYEFYLAFENEIGVPDYSTEKLWKTFRAGTVPIVLGRLPNPAYAPMPEAVIQTADYADAEHLAVYLNNCHSGTSCYSRHMAWRELPEEKLNPAYLALESTGTCELCRKLNAPTTRKSYDNAYKWFRDVSYGPNRRKL